MQRRTDRLQSTLEKLSDENEPSGWTTAAHLFNGVAYTALGTAMAFVDGGVPDAGFVRAVGATTAIVIGGPSLALGIRGLIGYTSTDEDRLVRFRQQRSAGALDPIAVARYEGELRADADLSRKLRITGGWLNLGAAVGGATLIAFAATSPLFDNGRILAYIEGGLLLVTGTIGAASGLGGESSNEREWRLYRDGEAGNQVQRVRIGLAPAVGPHSATVNIVGRF